MVIGIDPGKIMTFAFISNNKNNVYWRRAEIQTDAFIEVIKDIKRQSAYSEGGKIFIEYVHSMPTDGRKSAFLFGYSVGCLHSALKMEGLEYQLINPTGWRKYTNTHTKQDSIDYVKNKYPNVSLLATEKSRIDNHNIADAICIADYGYYILFSNNKEEKNG